MERLLSEKAFDILTLLADSDDSMTQRGIAESTGRSLGTINKTYNELIGEGYISDGRIDACLAAGIDDITVVRGYLSEQFDQLQSKYPMIKFVENNNYIEANNIYSAALVRDLLPNAYVFECDLHLMNPSLIKKYHYQSNILAIKKERSDDYCYERGKISSTNTFRLCALGAIDEQDIRDFFTVFREALEKYGVCVPVRYDS